MKVLLSYCPVLAVPVGGLLSLGPAAAPPVERLADGIRVAAGGGFLTSPDTPLGYQAAATGARAVTYRGAVVTTKFQRRYCGTIW